MERFQNLSLNPRAPQTAGCAAAGLSLRFVLTDGSDAGTFRLVPRWEPPPPKPTRINLMEFPNMVVSLPVGPLPPPVGQVVLMIAREGEQMSSVPLVRANSEQGSEEFKSREGNCYFNVRIDPSDGLATLRFYDIDQGVHWRSTGAYYIDLVAKDETAPQTTQHVFSSVEQLFRETVHFHGKDSLAVSYPRLRMNFKDFKHEGSARINKIRVQKMICGPNIQTPS